METAMPEPCGCPFSLRCSLPVPTCGKPTNVSSDSWEQVTGTWQCDTSKEHFPLAVGSPHRWKHSHWNQRENTESHGLHNGSLWKGLQLAQDTGYLQSVGWACAVHREGRMQWRGKARRQPLSLPAWQTAVMAAWECLPIGASQWEGSHRE